MGMNNSDISKCWVCGHQNPKEGFSPRYRNTCKSCARQKYRDYRFSKTGVETRQRHPWVDGTKKGNECGVEKPEEDYAWRDTPKGKRIRNSICKECLAQYQQDRKSDPEVRIKSNQAGKKYYDKGGHLKEKNARYLREYGITLEEKLRRIEENRGICPICLSDDPGRWWVVDHCHQTGKVRNVICDKCNKMLGLANDDPARLSRAAEYLLLHKEEPK